MDHNSTARLFIGIKTSKTVQTLFSQCVGQLPHDHFYKTIKWSHPENLHITLAFLGQTPMTCIPALIDTLVAHLTKQPTFIVGFEPAHLFPQPKRPVALVLGIHENKALLELAYQVKMTLLSCGLPIEQRRFRPHLTLGKTRKTINIPTEFTDPFLHIEEHVKSICIFDSQRIDNKTIYSIMHEIPLANF